MKRILLPAAFITLFIFAGYVLNAQTLINRAWLDTTGHPNDTLAIQFAATDGSSHYILLGNTWPTSDSEQILITKYTNAGSQVWQIRVPSPSTKRFIATNMDISNGYIYFCASPFDSVNNKSTFVTYKVSDSTGAISWSKQYTPSFTGYAVPAAVREDPSGNVYVVGTEQVNDTSYEMTFLQYNASGTLEWTTHYDSAGLYSSAVGIGAITKDSVSFAVSGYSGKTFGAWDIVSLRVNETFGTVSNVSRVSNGSGSFISHPVALAKDNSGDTYVVGASEVSGPNIDIKLIKYDSLFNQVFVKTWGGPDSLDDEPNYMVSDGSGNLLITGYTTHANGAVDLLVTKYSSSGTLLWSRTVNNRNPSNIHIAEGMSVTVDGSGNVYVTGKIYNGGNYDIETVVYSSNGSLLWEQTYDGGGSNDLGMNISLDNSANVYVSGTTSISTTKYITLMYQPLKIDNETVYDTSDSPLYAKGNIILRFSPYVLNLSAINDDGKAYGTPSQILTSPFVTTFTNELTNAGVNTKNCYLQKLAPHYHTWDSTLISKTGDTVKIAPFWSSFLLIYSGGGSNETVVRDSLHRLYPNIKYDHLNYTGTGSSSCGCHTLCADDSLYEQQYALHDDSLGTYTNGNIQAEGAWAIETGKAFVKVGVFDSGLEWGNEDFQASTGVTKVLGGYDYVGLDAKLLTIPSNQADSVGHGTSVSGIIGAIRNNNSGIAGVAGGNWCDSMSLSSAGVSLYGSTIGTPGAGPGIMNVNISSVISAMADALSNAANLDNVNLDILNFSMQVGNTGDTTFQDFKEKFYYAFRLGRIVVASRGNAQTHITGTAASYPACFPDNWLLCVGGSDENGDLAAHVPTIMNPTLPSLYGYPMDVIAPYYADMILSTSINSSGYSTFDGTSASAPYVTGLAGLLLSHLNNPNGMPDPKNLAVEDVEQIAERTAYFDSNLYTPPYDQQIGWGRVNLAAAMQMADTTHARLLHFDSHSNTSTYTRTKITGSDIIVNLQDNIPGDTSQHVVAGNYKAEVWEVSAVVHHHIVLKPKETIRAAWPRSSSSVSYAMYDSTSNYPLNDLDPYETAYMDSTVIPDTATATIWGYFYKLKDSTTSAVVGWYPIDPTDTTHPPKLAYTVYLDTVSHTVIPTAVSEIEDTKQFSLEAYPNPAKDMLHIVLTSSIENTYSIKLIDGLGREVETFFTGKTSYLSEDYNIGNLESGMYFIRVISTDETRALKLSIIK